MALMRDDSASFAARCFRQLNPRAEFATNWHFEAIAAKFAALRDGRIGRLIVNVRRATLSRTWRRSSPFPLGVSGESRAPKSSAQLRAGSRRQARARLPAHSHERLVPAALWDHSILALL